MATNKTSSNSRSKPNRPRATNKKPYFIFTGLLIFIISTIFALHYYLNSENIEPPTNKRLETLNGDLELATRPFDGPTFPLGQIFGETPVWGTLNSGHYFGLKLSSPNSIETSLMWFKNQLNREGRLDIRHLCDQNDRLNFYAWTRHDFHSFGEQTIIDQGYQIKTSFIKNPKNELEWRARIDVDHSGSANKTSVPLSVIQYVTTNDQNDKLELKLSTTILDETNNGNLFKVKGYSKDIGEFMLSINFHSNKEKFIYGNYVVGKIDKDLVPVSSYIHSRMLSTRTNGTRLFVLPGTVKVRQQDPDELNSPNGRDLIAYQLILAAPASFTIEFKQLPELTSESSDYESELKEKFEEFDEKFSQVFPIDEKLLNSSKSVEMLSKVAMSNMIGSVGYFYGESYISTSLNTNRVAPYGPIQLLTGVPSRSFFPRGFLWDEGFHNLLISRWDPALSNRIIKSWFDIMNVNGWIPREVILGAESMRRVPQEFIVQRITNANPPAMFIVLERMLASGTLEESTLKSIYPKLKVWYDWFNLTQAGPRPRTYRWRGRDEFSVSMLNPKTLTSGLDDYPRASHPSPHEYHIDLRCWMALAARTLAKLADRMGDIEFKTQISTEAQVLTDNRLLDELHWSEEHQMYCDFGYNTAAASMRWVRKTRLIKQTNQFEEYESYERHSTGHPKFGCVPEFGYVSLFPMLLNIIDPQNEKLGIILDRLQKETELWSDYGIRSLSKQSQYYKKDNTEHDKPYWRGAIWLNLNYLILSSLKSYSKLDGPYRDRCSELFVKMKEIIVNNVSKEFSRTNYLWENYDDQSGKGSGSHPFTGWSSLVLLIMSSHL